MVAISIDGSGTTPMLVLTYPFHRSAPAPALVPASFAAADTTRLLLLVVLVLAIGRRPSAAAAAGPTTSTETLQHDAAAILGLELVACLAPLPASRIESLAQRTGPASWRWTFASTFLGVVIRGSFVC